MGDPAPDSDDRCARSRHARGRRRAEEALTPETDPQKLLTEACLHGLMAKLCDDIDALDNYLPPRIAQMARKVADALEVPQPAPA
ncbi:hypothetical protein [Streptomyces sp. NPDC042319]|uniref:hypothetical protein n=1 Tax=Streptomyces sp. NPDC042319 TaxID=3154332 RepID=UPI00340D2A68